MATFIPFLTPPLKDGSIRIIIKLHHKNRRRMIGTEIRVLPEDVTKKGKIKSHAINLEIQNILQAFRISVQKLGLKINSMTVEEIANYLTMSSQKDVDFFEFADELIAEYKKENKTGMASNYQSAINSLKSFTKSDRLNFNDLNSKFLFNYAAFLKTSKNRANSVNPEPIGNRALSLYTSIFRAILNKAKAKYNDEEYNINVIHVNPFSKFKVPAEGQTSYRSLSPELILQIRDFIPEISSQRVSLARDAFMLSFYLCGINSVDLFNNPKIENGRIIYNRQKTTTRRNDQAIFNLNIEPEAKIILDKYSTNNGLTFSSLFASPNTFNQSINKGLKIIGKSIGVPDLTFYSARHSWATIANNDCEIDKYTVHLALNHVDEEMKITDRYIRKDWSIIDKANSTVLDYIFSYRSLSKELLIQIRDFIPDADLSRLALARDAFMLSFYLCGINSNDLFNNPKIENGRIIFNNQKTTTEINDQAFFNLNIVPEAKIILDKYSNNNGLTFSTLFPSPDTFIQTINKGLKVIGKKIGFPDLSLLSARQSWATFANNDCKIDKYTIHSALNHNDEEMKITDKYISKDRYVIDKANRTVLDFIIS